MDLNQRQLVFYSERQLKEDGEGHAPVDEEDVMDGAEENVIVIVDSAEEDPIKNQHIKPVHYYSDGASKGLSSSAKKIGPHRSACSSSRHYGVSMIVQQKKTLCYVSHRHNCVC